MNDTMKMNLSLICVIIGAVVVILDGFTPVSGEIIGIDLSSTCLIMLKNNLTTNCPTYEEILGLFPDQSNQDVSGKFEVIDGIYKRSTKHLDDHYQFYLFDSKPMIWIDPPADVYGRIKTVTITSGDFVYKVGEQRMINSTIQLGQSRYIEKCTHALISADNWLFLAGDTVQHLLLGCRDGTTNFDEIKIQKFAKTNHDITTTAKYKLETWVNEVKKNCLTEFMKCKDNKTYKRFMTDGLLMGDKF